MFEVLEEVKLIMNKYIQHMRQELGLKPLAAPCSEQFQFGDGNIESADKKYFYPVFVKGVYRGMLDQASVNVNCPQLLSKMVMQKWDVDLCFGKKQTRIGKFNVMLPFSEASVPVVNIFDVTQEQLKEQWSRIPEYFKVNTDKVESKFKVFGKNGSFVYPVAPVDSQIEDWTVIHLTDQSE